MYQKDIGNILLKSRAFDIISCKLLA